MSVVGAPEARAVTMQITYTDGSSEGFYDPTLGAQRRKAFEAVVSNWGKRLSGNVPIKISASFDPLGLGDSDGMTLAQASPYNFSRDWSNFFNQLPAPQRSATYYPSALANQQAGKDLDESHTDIVVTCNSDVDTQSNGFYYGLNGDVPDGQSDFYTVVYHEVGHGLGFLSSFNPNGTFGFENGYASIFDIFMAGTVNGTGQYLTKVTEAQRAAVFRGGPIWFAGTNATLGNSDASCLIYAPSVFDEGSSISHLDEATFSGPEELMTPFASGSVHAPGRRVTGIFKDMGWNISATDTTKPTVTLTTPTDGSVVGSLPAIRGTVSDMGVGVSRVRVTLQVASSGQYWNGTTWVSAATPPELRATISSGSWSITSSLPSSLTRTKYNLSVTAWDQAQNSKNIASSFDVADVSAPTVTINYPTENKGYKTAPLATGSSSENTDYVKVALRNSAGAYWDWTAGGEGAFGSTEFSDNAHAKRIQVPPTSWSLQIPSLPEGDYILFASGVNTADIGSEYVPLPFYIDSTGPELQVTSPAHNSSVASLTAISGEVNDRSGIYAKEVKFTLYQNGQFWNGTAWTNTQSTLTATVDEDGSWTYSQVPTGSNVRAGLYYVSASALDTLSNLSTPTSGINQTSFRVDTNPPTCTITSPLNNSSVTGLTSITGTADDNAGIDRVSLYILRMSDNAFWDGTAFAGGGSAILSVNYDSSSKTWRSNGTLPGTNQSDPARNWTNGSYNIIAIAYDAAGNEKRADCIVTYEYVYTWTGATLRDNDGNNDSHSWDTAANWFPLGVPGANDSAIIANGDTVQADGSHSVKSLTLTDSTLNTTGFLIKNLDLKGALNGGAINSNGGTWNWRGGSISGTWSVLVGATLNISNPADVAMGDTMTLNNEGTINWNGPGKVYTSGYYGPATINNKSGGVFNLTTDGTPLSTTYGANFNNAAGAKFVKTGGSSSTSLSGWTFNNSGELRSNVGVANYGSTLNLNNGGTITGVGKHEVSAGVVNISGGTTINGSSLTVSGGKANSVGALATVMTTAGGSWNWSGGTISGTIANKGTFNISGTATKTFGDTSILNNSGTVTWSAGPIYCSGYYGPTKFNNMSGGTFTATSGNSFTTTYGSIFNNQSGATFSSNSATTTSNWAFNNDGLAKASTGVLALNAGGKGSGRLQTVATSLVKFTGGSHELSGPRFIGLGKVQLTGGSITLGGNLTLGDSTSPSTLEVIGGTLTGTETKVNGVVTGNSIIASGNGAPSRLNWTGGTIGGKLNWALSLQTFISDATTGKTTKTFADSTVLNNDGAATWSGTGPIYCNSYYGQVAFNNRRGSSFTFANAGIPFSTTYGAKFNNQLGAKLVKNGTGILTLNSWNFSNAGSIATTGMTAFLSPLDLEAGTTFTGVGTARFAGTVNAKAPFSSAGPIQLDGGSLNGSATTAFTGPTFNWTQGSITGQFTFNPGSIVTVSGTGAKGLGDNTTLNNKGTIRWVGTAPIAVSGYYGSSTINNLYGATFDVGQFGIPFTTTYGSNFNNQAGAKLVKSLGSGTVSLNGWTFNNTGAVVTSVGKTEFLSTLNINAGTTFTGAGIIRLAGTTNAKAPFSSAGPIQLDGGSLNGSATAAFTGPAFAWVRGSISGQLTLNPASVITVSGTVAKTLGDNTVLNNKGTVKWIGTAPIYSSGYYGWSTVNNFNGATFDVANNGIPFTTTYGANFNNQLGAKFVKSAGTSVTTFSGWTFNSGSWANNILLLGGSVETKVGILAFNTAVNLRGGSFKGAGQHIFSGGTITVGAPVTIDNNQLTWSGGTLNSVTSGTKAVGAVSTLGTGKFNWTGGKLTGTFSILPKSVATISGTADKAIDDNTTLSNAGALTWSAGNIVNSGYYGSSFIKNLYGATFAHSGVGALKTTYGSNFSNAGTLTLGSSILNSAWSFTQTSTGISALEIRSATLFGQFKTTSGVTLAGYLNAAIVAPYVPAVNTAFKVITHGTRAGVFGRVNVTGETTRLYAAQYNPADVTIKVNAKTTAAVRSLASSTPQKTAVPEVTPVPTATPEPTPAPTLEPTPLPTPTKVPSPSISLSSASVNVGGSSVQLIFVQGLDATSATDLNHYRASINGQSVELQGVSLKGNTVTLLLPEGSLQVNDSVTVVWNGLKDRAHNEFGPGSWNNGQNPT